MIDEQHQNHPKINNKTGILLVNLGTPDQCNNSSIRKYLREFLSDRRIIDLNPFIWQIILNCFILPFRPRKTVKKYQKIWLKPQNQSPLQFYSKQQAKEVQKIYPNLEVDYAMRYGNPSLKLKIHELIDKGCHKITFIPLYPQYSSTTTASVCDEIYRILNKMKWQPDIKIIQQYHDNTTYINSLVSSLKNHLQKINFQPDIIISSYHGIPMKYFQKGDPYYCFCQKTNRLFNEALKKNNINLKSIISFQSRFGPKKWLQPYSSDIIKELGRKKTKIIVIAPGFASDCLETLEEISIELKNDFLNAGGEYFSYIPCLNDSKEFTNIITDLIN